MPPTTIANRFTIADPQADLLGRGGMGAVYRALDAQTDQPVAIKVLKSSASQTELIERFRREGEALRQLNHPNIVQYIAAIEENEQYYLVMEYVSGGSLGEWIDAAHQAKPPQALPIPRILAIMLEVADALTRAHHLGIIHRDLKPANVLLAQDGTPRLSDFGIAHFASRPSLTEAGLLVGTLDYISPEACRGEKIDGRADIWAFGVMLYEMLAGSLPFPGDTITTKLATILTLPPPDLQQRRPEVTPALADLVYRMLEKDRQRRIPSMRLVGAELEAILLECDECPSELLESPLRRFAAHTPSPHLSQTIPPGATSGNLPPPRHHQPTQPTTLVGPLYYKNKTQPTIPKM